MTNLLHKRKPPRYIQLIQYIEENIESKKWGPHHKLPSEQVLSEQFGFARGTVRQAISELVNAGIIYRIQGKGSYVGPQMIQHDVSNTRFKSFLEEFVEKKLSFETLQLGCEVLDAFEPIVSTMVLPPAQKELARIKRLRVSSDEPFMYSENHIPLFNFPGFDTLNYQGRGIYDILAEKYGFVYGSIQRIFQAVSAEGHVAKYLKVRVGTPLMLANQIVFDVHGTCVDYAFIWLRSDKVEISVNP